MFLFDDLHLFLLCTKTLRLAIFLIFKLFKFLNNLKDMFPISFRLVFYRLRKAFGCKYSLLC